MARIFTDVHRKKHYRRKDDPRYHGDECERLYVEGLEVLAKMKYFQTAIGAMRRRERMLVTTTKQFGEWERLGMLYDTSSSYLDLLRNVNWYAARMKEIRIAYTEAHSVRHNVPKRYEVRGPDGNVIECFCSHGAASQCRVRSGLGCTMSYIRENK